MTEDVDQSVIDPSDTVETVHTKTKPVVETKVVKEPKIRDANDAILELRKENERLRKTMEEQSTVRAEELANKKLDDLRASTEAAATKNAEKLIEQRLQDAEQANRARLIKAELKAQALRANVVDWEDLYLILAKDLQSIEFDADGDVKNAAELIANIKGSKPYLFGGINTSSTERTPQTREASKDEKPALTMSREDYERGKTRLARM
jgi:hypothetical protein